MSAVLCDSSHPSVAPLYYTPVRPRIFCTMQSSMASWLISLSAHALLSCCTPSRLHTPAKPADSASSLHLGDELSQLAAFTTLFQDAACR